MLYDNFNEIGKNNITATSSDFIKLIGEQGIKDIILSVLLGGNVRDVTEFITQKRLVVSYASLLELAMNIPELKENGIDSYCNNICSELINTHNKGAKLLNLWLLGQTLKGLDNIVRGEENIKIYKEAYIKSLKEVIDELKNTFGELSGSLTLNGKEINLNWDFLILLFIALGSQTLSIRGSAKSMNGKLFEKLVLGTLFTLLGFTYYQTPPSVLDKRDRIFWLSNMDENERETDATLVYNSMAISIDIGFIGKGNPEITLDKVSRYNKYKQIAGFNHTMSTIIIVDTVGDNSDLFNKAKRIEGKVLQMRHNDWIIQLANIICDEFKIKHYLQNTKIEDLKSVLKEKMSDIDISPFVL